MQHRLLDGAPSSHHSVEPSSICWVLQSHHRDCDRPHLDTAIHVDGFELKIRAQRSHRSLAHQICEKQQREAMSEASTAQVNTEPLCTSPLFSSCNTFLLGRQQGMRSVLSETVTFWGFCLPRYRIVLLKRSVQQLFFRVAVLERDESGTKSVLSCWSVCLLASQKELRASTL